MNQQISRRKIILVTGAARSGKSEWAEQLAALKNDPVTYIATAYRDSTDLEWEARLNQHRLRRPTHWQTKEIPLELATTIAQAKAPHCLIVDSLGTWVSNCLNEDGASWQQISLELLTSLQQSQVEVILVAEETGWGVVPAYPVGRLFRDRLGHLIRQIGIIADVVYLVTGGHVLNLSQLGQPLIKNQQSDDFIA
ncbi:bifunctional adenosylcobinamide kinase/adenosylcobinamide-phosphate guanylyltransferase [Gloeothece verrucosa]|uniref:Adenosylcobinamide kinase n=1 Tax=Gloeothece verrucosa (strain PCC 7822) TaxID=497965 RepID=E0UAY8_GLOV7|nr:bifunctional adenosylcobinamide kinase/adenosylcobinamide-phosphate guanylyltransferase [Gloeothece verrucosa]ADN15110.1 cobalbumin biosynthesis protein [Gloeothece verrucosa PCC 7822]